MDSVAIPVESGETPQKMRKFVMYFLRLGTFGFGGPIALAGHMQKDLVEERKWVSSQDYVEGLAFSQLSPGPLAAQLAMYLGWVRFGTLGATLTGAAFVLPSFLMVMALAGLYVHYGRLQWIQGVFYGVGAAVIAIIARSAYKLIRSTLKNDWLLWALFAALAVTTAWKESEIVWLFLLCGIVSMMVRAPSSGRIPSGTAFGFVGMERLFTGMLGPATAATTGTLFLFLAGNCAVPLWWRRKPVSLADGTAVCRRGGGGNDHAGTGGDYRGICRISGCGAGGSAACGVRGVRAAVCDCDCGSAALPAILRRTHR
jgi:chromate transporter